VSAADATRDDIFEILDAVKDPEVPVLSVVELGIVRGARVEGNAVTITVTPTYSGCPAMRVIEEDIRSALLAHGFGVIHVEAVYAPVLQGAPLVSNKSVWRNFPNVRNERWFAGNTVLIGDALRTAHFSIGSGTRLAMEDAIALAKALREQPLPKALPAFVAARRPIVDKLVAAADASGAWYDNFPQHMKHAPRDFAWSYIQRSGRIDPARLARTSPRFART